MHLVPFDKKHYPLLVSWIPNDEFNLLWGGPLYSWPITVDQIAAQQARCEVTSFLLVVGEINIGFIELIKAHDKHYRLCRILIAAEESRGKGYGKKLVELAMDHAENELGAKKLSLAVFENNERAIQCYSSLGFQIISREEKSREFNGQWWPLLRMEKDL